jgi:glutamate-ammonia-ligase adenylyltransferase
MALTRARVVSATPAFTRRIEAAIRDTLCRRRDPVKIATDVLGMRAAIAEQKGDADLWDLKYAKGGLVDIEFVAQYVQLVNAADAPTILDTSTVRVLEKAAHAGVLARDDVDILRPAAVLFHSLTQILRLCLPGAFDPKTANAGVMALLARAADLPDFAALAAYVEEEQRRVRAALVRILAP